MIKNDINNHYNDIFIHMQEWRVFITENRNRGQNKQIMIQHTTTLSTISLHLIDRNFFSPIYIVVRAVNNCVLSENWREYKSEKSSGEIGGEFWSKSIVLKKLWG